MLPGILELSVYSVFFFYIVLIRDIACYKVDEFEEEGIEYYIESSLLEDDSDYELYDETLIL